MRFLAHALISLHVAMAVAGGPVLAQEDPSGIASWFHNPNHQAAYKAGLRVAFDFRELPYPVFVCSDRAHAPSDKEGTCVVCQKPLERATHAVKVAIRRARPANVPVAARRAPDWQLGAVTRHHASGSVDAVWRETGNVYQGYLSLQPGDNQVTARIERTDDGRTEEFTVTYQLPEATSQVGGEHKGPTTQTNR